jgi:hypothetical protein
MGCTAVEATVATGALTVGWLSAAPAGAAASPKVPPVVTSAAVMRPSIHRFISALPFSPARFVTR